MKIKLVFLIFLIFFLAVCFLAAEDKKQSSVAEKNNDYILKLNIAAKTKRSLKKTTGLISFKQGESTQDVLYKTADGSVTINLEVKLKDFSKLPNKENPMGLKRATVITYTAPPDYRCCGILFYEYIDIKRNTDIWDYYPVTRRAEYIQESKPFPFCAFSHSDFLSSIDKLTTQREIVLSGEKITLIDQSLKELEPEIFSNLKLFECR
jgi:hypothetical protein